MFRSACTWFFLVVLCASLGMFREKAFRDPGSLWHIRVGEIILADGFPRTDPFTYTFAGRPWVPQQWLAEVGMAAIHQYAGLDGLLVAFCVGIAALHTCVFTRLQLAGMSPFLAGLSAAALLFVGSFHYYARPHMATVLGMGLTVAWLVDVDRGRRPVGYLWWLVPVFVLWTNLHGGMLGGLVTLGLFAIARMIAQRTVDVRLALIVLVCGLTPLVNPFGLDMLRTWFSIVGSTVLKQAVSEHHPLSLAVPADRLVVLVGFVFVSLAVGNWRQARVTWLLPTVWLLLAFTSIRHGPLFVIAAAFVIPDIVASWRRGGEPAPVGPPANLASQPLAGIGEWRPGIVSCLVIFTIIALPVLGVRGWARLDPAAHPVAFTDAIHEWAATTGPTDRLYNDANFGGYLIRFHPRLSIFMDDRFEQYGEDWCREYVDVIWHHPERFDDWDRRWKFGLALVATDTQPTPLDRHLASKPDWQEVARLPTAVLFRRR